MYADDRNTSPLLRRQYIYISCVTINWVIIFVRKRISFAYNEILNDRYSKMFVVDRNRLIELKKKMFVRRCLL